MSWTPHIHRSQHGQSLAREIPRRRQRKHGLASLCRAVPGAQGKPLFAVCSAAPPALHNQRCGTARLSRVRALAVPGTANELSLLTPSPGVT